MGAIYLLPLFTLRTIRFEGVDLSLVFPCREIMATKKNNVNLNVKFSHRFASMTHQLRYMMKVWSTPDEGSVDFSITWNIKFFNNRDPKRVVQ